MSEHEIQQRILLACGRGDTRIWRNNVGTGWAGPATKVTAGNLRAVAQGLRPGDVVIRGGRPLHAGLCVGSADLIGFRNHNGIAQFVAIEVKSATGRVSEQQERFLELVRTVGGCSGIARSVGDAERILSIP